MEVSHNFIFIYFEIHKAKGKLKQLLGFSVNEMLRLDFALLEYKARNF